MRLKLFLLSITTVVLAIAIIYLNTRPAISPLGYAIANGLKIDAGSLSGDTLFYPEGEAFLVLLIEISSLYFLPDSAEYAEMEAWYQETTKVAHKKNNVYFGQPPEDLPSNCPAAHYVQIVSPESFQVTLKDGRSLNGVYVAHWGDRSSINWYESARRFEKRERSVSLKTSFWMDAAFWGAKRLLPSKTVGIAFLVEKSLNAEPVTLTFDSGPDMRVPSVAVENPEMIYYEIEVSRDPEKHKALGDPLEKLEGLKGKRFGYRSYSVCIEPFFNIKEVEAALSLIAEQDRTMIEVITHPRNYRLLLP